ncbi:hypothetical protein BTIS_1000 [Bifidobacterium tissieri]|uniref:DUF1963 domain-containing protein n=1 Tax=Bifidobacterium tissieri TaxID=1630162 RepID=A0A261FF40_9BIFI|nr:MULTISPECIES: DUF1963 domain-containing protein [Bifidobacterium]OZG57759.1 hypothetical protein BTIS_1000 [Bifidobacterium tissieri]TPF96309.1 hypothetical protein EP30_08315 [Bifidobacterium sp. UTCIF-39]
MSLLDRLFGKKPSAEQEGLAHGIQNPIDASVTGIQRDEAYADTSLIPQLSDYVAQMIVSMLRHSTDAPMIELDASDTPPNVLDTKIGGEFYVPSGMRPPRNHETGKPLYLLAQLNFDELPHLPDFPEHGLLQFFIAGDDPLYGMNLDHPQSQKKWRIRYIPTVPDTVPPTHVAHPSWRADTDLPLPDKNYAMKLVPTLTAKVINTTDYRFDGALQRCLSTMNDRDRDFYRTHEGEILDTINDMLAYGGHQIGGYPLFTQWDPRPNGPWHGADTLLLQIDSIDDVMFADSGVANFFIRPDQLRRLDFSQVLFHWDCM